MSDLHRQTGRREWASIRRTILARDGRRCQECGKAGRLEVHHLLPLKHGGDDSVDNLKTMCRDCHISAHARPVSAMDAEWQPFVDELR